MALGQLSTTPAAAVCGLHTGFLRSAEAFPGRPALEVAGARLTYAELRDRAASVAATLERHASGEGPPLTGVLVLTSLPPAWRDQTATGAAADYFFDVWWRAAATALVFNAFPVERSGGKGRATHLAGEMLNDGWNLLVFPEGTRSKDGWVRDFRMGAARLAVEHAVPVVPVALRGTYQAMPRGAAWPAKGRKPVTVRFGRALRPRDDETATEFNQRMRAGLAITLSEDRTTWWDAIRNGERDEASGPDVARWRRVP